MNQKSVQKNKIKETEIWEYLARVLPFVALFLIVSAYLFDYNNTYHIVILSVIGTFFTIAVIWWFWAIKTIAHIFYMLDHTAQSFSKIEQDIDEFKKNIISDRER